MTQVLSSLDNCFGFVVVVVVVSKAYEDKVVVVSRYASTTLINRQKTKVKR